jgi:predicted metal-binding protein
MIIQFDKSILEISVKYQGICLCKSNSFRNGCPNYGKKPGCPPRNLFSEDYDLREPIYLIATDFDLTEHAQKIRNAHPNWTEKAIYNSRYWQNTARNRHLDEIQEFMSAHPNYSIERSPEGSGINIDSLCRQQGIVLEWPPRKVSRVVSIGAIRK